MIESWAGKAWRCEHGTARSVHKECGGASCCKHGRRRSRCKECGNAGSASNNTVEHNGQEVLPVTNEIAVTTGPDAPNTGPAPDDPCKALRVAGARYWRYRRRVGLFHQPVAVVEMWTDKVWRCEHGRGWTVCKECRRARICEHGKGWTVCKECGGGSICEHGRKRSDCKEC